MPPDPAMLVGGLRQALSDFEFWRDLQVRVSLRYLGQHPGTGTHTQTHTHKHAHTHTHTPSLTVLAQQTRTHTQTHTQTHTHTVLAHTLADALFLAEERPLLSWFKSETVHKSQ